jgi:hypothetical protein
VSDTTIPTPFDLRGHCRSCDGFMEHFATCPELTRPLSIDPIPYVGRERSVRCQHPGCRSTVWTAIPICAYHQHPAGRVSA